MLLFNATVELVVKMASFLSDALLVDDFMLHLLNEAPQCIELSLALHLCQSVFANLPLFHVCEGAVHSPLHVLPNQT